MKSANAIFTIAIGLMIALWMGFHVFSSYQPISAVCELLPVVGLFLGFASMAMAIVYLTLITSCMGWIQQLLFVELGYLGSFNESMLMLSLALCVFGALIKSILMNSFGDSLFRNIIIWFTVICLIVIGWSLKRWGLSMSGASASLSLAPWLMIPVAFYRKKPGHVGFLVKWLVVASVPAVITCVIAFRQRYWGFTAFEDLFWIGNYGVAAIGGDPRFPEAPGITSLAPNLTKFASLVAGYGILGCVLFRPSKRNTLLWILSVLLILAGVAGILGTGRRFGYAFILFLPIALYVVGRKSLTVLSYVVVLSMIGFVALNGELVEHWVTEANKAQHQAKVGTGIAAGSELDAVSGVGTLNARVRTYAMFGDPDAYSLWGIPAELQTPMQQDAHGLPVQILLASGVVGLGGVLLLGIVVLYLFHKALLKLRTGGVFERVGFVAGVIVLLQLGFFVAGQKSGRGAIGMIQIMTHLSVAICAVAHQGNLASSVRSKGSLESQLPAHSMSLRRA